MADNPALIDAFHPARRSSYNDDEKVDDESDDNDNDNDNIRKVAGSILLVAAFSRLGGYSVFRRVIAPRPALSGGAWHLLAQRVSASRIPLGDGARAGLAALFLSLIIIQAYARLSGACRPQGGRGCLSDA